MLQIPGEYIEININDLSIKKIKPRTDFKILINDQKNFNTHELVEDNLIKSISRRFVSDVPVSVLLSGRMNSSLITILAKKFINYDFDTYHLGYENTETSLIILLDILHQNCL